MALEKDLKTKIWAVFFNEGSNEGDELTSKVLCEEQALSTKSISFSEILFQFTAIIAYANLPSNEHKT